MKTQPVNYSLRNHQFKTKIPRSMIKKRVHTIRHRVTCLNLWTPARLDRDILISFNHSNRKSAISRMCHTWSLNRNQTTAPNSSWKTKKRFYSWKNLSVLKFKMTMAALQITVIKKFPKIHRLWARSKSLKHRMHSHNTFILRSSWLKLLKVSSPWPYLAHPQ